MPETCPRCGERMTDTPGFTPWCPACEFNLLPGNRFGTAKARQRQVDELMSASSEEESTRDRRRRRSVLLIAGAVHGVPLALALGGLVLVAAFRSADAMAGAFICLGLAIWLRPRFAKGNPDAVALHLEQLPELQRLLSSICEGLETRVPQRVELAPTFETTLTRLGLRQRRVLTIGAPMWLTLRRDERIATITIELARDATGDSRRNLFIRSAVDTLDRFLHLVDPTIGGGRRRLRDLAVVAVLMPYRLLFGWFVKRGADRLFTATQRQRRAAEHRADLTAAALAGSRATKSALGSALLGPGVMFTMNRARLRREGLFEALEAYLDGMPDLERKRLVGQSAALGTVDFAWRPSTASRIAVLESAGHQLPELSSLSHPPLLDKELEPLIIAIEPSVKRLLSRMAWS